MHAPQEMRRTAPEERAAKRQRTEDGFQELSRFDYAATDTLVQGFQGFLLTCGFRRCLRSQCTVCLYHSLTRLHA